MNKDNVVQLFSDFKNLESDFTLENILKRLSTGNVADFVSDVEEIKTKILEFYNNKSKISQSFQLLPLVMTFLHLYNKHQDFIKEIYEKADTNWEVFEKSVIIDAKDNPHLVEKLSEQIIDVTFKFVLDVMSNDTGKEPNALYDDLSIALTALVKDCAKDLDTKE